ncbi:DNA polymerase III subunit delta' [Kordiimonas gwangyangensis]|uniref:DNA polymerase III subunit delta' n=1 Tax=Kordiimonas gwangyangensis TaxID=288022 RepID=UPI000381F1E2|nr:DNA polymerase III subunit delta' [Kordiimonas gwangyangensis]
MSDETTKSLFHPRATEHLFGHEAAERQFLEAFNGERLHHAWLITGPKGIGKATLAWRIAKFLAAQPAEDAGAGLFGEALPTLAESLVTDSQNPVIQRVVSGGHGGIIVAERTENEKTGKLRNDIVIDDIRKLIGFFSQTSAEGGWRVAVVDAADEMNVNAANALLKLLEEPPAKSILILVAHSPGKLLPTIRSRCRTLKLKPLGEDSVRAVLALQHPSLSPEELTALARLSNGAPGRAMELAALGGVNLYKQMAGFLTSLPRIDIPALHTLAGQLAAPKADQEYRLFVAMLLDWLERLIRQAASGVATTDVMAGESAEMMRISTLTGLDQWMDLWEKMGRLIARADAVNLDRKQVLVHLFSSLGTLARA